MVDSILLLVDAAEGPLPQTRYVLQKAMARHLPVVVAINKIDRGDARPAEVVDAVYELFIDLGADEHQIDFPIVYTNAKAGTATLDLADARHGPAAAARPAGRAHAGADLPAGPSAPAAGHQPLGQRLRRPHGGRADLERHDPHGPAHHGRARGGRFHRRLGRARAGRSRSPAPSPSLTTARGIEREEIREAGPGEIVAVAGLPEVTIGDTITDPADPRPLPRLDVDEPTLRMTFGVNTSPLSGRDGKFADLPPDQGAARPRGARQRLDRGAARPSRPTRSRCAAGASCSWPC